MRQIPPLFKAKGNIFPFLGVSVRLHLFSVELFNDGFADLTDDFANSTVVNLPGIVDLVESAITGQIPKRYAQLRSRFEGWPSVGVDLYQTCSQMILEEVEGVWIHSHNLPSHWFPALAVSCSNFPLLIDRMDGPTIASASLQLVCLAHAGG